jgi:hypothetical protein
VLCKYQYTQVGSEEEQRHSEMSNVTSSSRSRVMDLGNAERDAKKLENNPPGCSEEKRGKGIPRHLSPFDSVSLLLFPVLRKQFLGYSLGEMSRRGAD